MDATFRRPRSHLITGVLGLPLFLVGVSGGVWMTLNASGANTWPARLALGSMVVGVPLFMSGLGIWVILDYFRAELTFQGNRITSRSGLRTKQIDLLEIKDLRWVILGGKVVLRTDSERLAIHFSNIEEADHERIIHHLRSIVPAEIQNDWNLFAYKTQYGQPRPDPRRKPGPGEERIPRSRWTLYFAPLTVVAVVGGIIAYSTKGEFRYLCAPLGPLLMWAFIRYSTPVEGMILSKIVRPNDPDTNRSFLFLLVWTLVGIAGLIADGFRRHRRGDLDALLIGGFVIWFAILLIEVTLIDRRRSRREREEADLAAKARGETTIDSWHSE